MTAEGGWGSRLVVLKLEETWALLNGDRRRGGPGRGYQKARALGMG